MKLNPAEILREAAYKEGYKAGKAFILSQVITDLSTALKAKTDFYNHISEYTFDGQTACSACGAAEACEDIQSYLEQLKKKYEVN